MYLLIDNKPYALVNDKICEVEIKDGELIIGEEAKGVENNGIEYTYDEISRKFNLEYQRAVLGEPTQELVDELNKQIASLTKENEKLKSQLNKTEEEVVEEEAEEEQPIEETPAEEVEEVVEEKEIKKNK